MDLTNSEKLLMKWAGDDIDISDLEPISRFDEIALSKINGTTYDKEPQSRMEALMLRLPSAGGGYPEPTGTIGINENGLHDVKQYAIAEVNVPSVTPTGTLEITENGTYDVTDKASAVVDVQGGSDFKIDDASYLFVNSARANNADKYIDVLDENIVSTEGMFDNARNFYNASKGKFEIPKFNTSNVTNMKYMFRNITSGGNNSSLVTNGDNYLDLDTSNVEDMGYMFYNCSFLNYDFLSNLNTSNVEDMSNMFDSNSRLVNYNIPENIDFSKVKKFNYFLNNCSNLETVYFPKNTNFSNVKNMNSMFRSCTQLKNVMVKSETSSSIALSAAVDTSNVENMGYMFYGCEQISNNTYRYFDTSNTTNMSYMLFQTCSTNSANNYIYVDYDFSKVSRMDYMFAQNNKATTIYISRDKFDFSFMRTVNTNGLFSGCASLKTVYIGGNDVLPITNTNAFASVPSNCKFYVPNALLTQYKAATNWSARANYIYGY